MADALTVPLTIEVGEWTAWRTTVRTGGGVTLPDLSDYRARIRYSGPPLAGGTLPPARLELSTENGGVLRDGALFRWTITPEQSRLLADGGLWQMYVIAPSGHPTRIYQGPITLSPEIKAPRAP